MKQLQAGSPATSGPSQVEGRRARAPHFLADQLTLSQPGGAHYAHHIHTCHPGFFDLATALGIHLDVQ